MLLTPTRIFFWIAMFPAEIAMFLLFNSNFVTAEKRSKKSNTNPQKTCPNPAKRCLHQHFRRKYTEQKSENIHQQILQRISKTIHPKQSSLYPIISKKTIRTFEEFPPFLRKTLPSFAEIAQSHCCSCAARGARPVGHRRTWSWKWAPQVTGLTNKKWWLNQNKIGFL